MEKLPLIGWPLAVNDRVENFNLLASLYGFNLKELPALHVISQHEVNRIGMIDQEVVDEVKSQVEALDIIPGQRQIELNGFKSTRSGKSYRIGFMTLPTEEMRSLRTRTLEVVNSFIPAAKTASASKFDPEIRIASTKKPKHNSKERNKRLDATCPKRVLLGRLAILD